MGNDLDLYGMSDEDLEALAFDLNPDSSDKEDESTDESSAEAVADAADDEDEGEQTEEDAPEVQPRGNLTNALREARSETRAERDARIQAETQLRIMEQQLRQLTQYQQPSQQESEESELSFLEDPDAYIERRMAAKTQDVQRVIDQIKAENATLKIQMAEAALSPEDQQDYRELVNLNDPDHFFKQWVDSTPGALQAIFNAQNPVQYALRVARNLQVATNRDVFDSKVKEREASIRRDERERVLKELQGKVVERTKSSVKSPQSVARLSGSTGNFKASDKDPRRMSNAELEEAAFQ